MMENLLKLFKEFQIDFQLYQHEPVFTVQEGIHLREQIPGAHSKNLFLKDRKKQFYLISVLEHKKVDLKSLSHILGKKDLSFGKSEELMQKLQLLPGSVTPYGLIHDEEKTISFILDKEFLNYEMVNFHPLRNDMTIGLSLPSFLEFFDRIDHAPNILEIPIT